MKAAACACLMVTVLLNWPGAILADASDAKDVQKHADSLRGTWTCVSAIANGKPVPEAVRRALRLELGRHTYRTYRNKTRLFDGTYVIHAAGGSPQIDITSVDEENKDKTALGIYTLKGDTLKLCYAMPGQARPQKFESTSAGTSLTVWQRAKR
ncbi:MAG TPA: TIGR03067 domain-containing protein [Gemmataceae bacterium]|nr:TIGR03067 domain-containing protein [Gemmataceae bacterium]